MLAFVAYLLYGSRRRTRVQPAEKLRLRGTPRKVPIADVQQAGGYDIVKVPVKVPIADVQQAGGYDVFNASVPVTAARQQLPAPPALTRRSAG